MIIRRLITEKRTKSFTAESKFSEKNSRITNTSGHPKTKSEYLVAAPIPNMIADKKSIVMFFSFKKKVKLINDINKNNMMRVSVTVKYEMSEIIGLIEDSAAIVRAGHDPNQSQKNQ